MSRNSNRGPRADIALLRKLKADPNFSPASLLNAGPNFLDKANKLKGFVAEQRGKLCASSAKTEWFLAYQHLQGEQDDAYKELNSYLQQFGELHQSPDMREIAEAGYTLQSQAEACRAERLRLRSQVKRLSSQTSSYKSYGTTSHASQQVHALKDEMAATGQELQATLTELAGQVQLLTGQLREVWPSAVVAAPGDGLAGGVAASSSSIGLGLGSGDTSALPGHSRAQDAEELERMMARYPLASPDTKDRIREVFHALQDKYFERLETWRLEAEQSARDLASWPSGADRSGVSAPLGRLPRRQTSQTAAGTQPSRAEQGRVTAGVAAASSGSGRTAAVGGAAGKGGPRLAAIAAAAAPGGGSPGPPPALGTAVGTSGRARGRQLEPVAAEAAGDDGGLEVLPSPVAGLLPSPSGRAAETSWVFSGCGGWAAEEHSAFVRHRERLMKECGQGVKSGSREAIMARIATLLPGGRSTAEVLAHDDWTAAARLVARRRRDLAEGWDRELRQFLEDSSSFLQESETLFFVAAEEAADRLIAELVRERARDELQEMRAERVREEEVATAEQLVRDTAEAEARLAAEARERRHRAAQKDMIAAYRAELERQLAEEMAATAEAERQAALLTEQQALYNRERVEVRHSEYLEKQDKAKERQEALEAEAQARAARLDRLRALVAPLVEADPARVLAPTAASTAVVDKAEGAFHPVNGYSTEQVVKDQRFKVFEALSALGLQQTDYGRRVIAAARPAKATRPDNFTSDQREAMMKG